MKAIWVLILIWSAKSNADDPACGQRNREWSACKTVSDCLLVADGCGARRIPVNKWHSTMAEKFYACTHKKKEDCPPAASDAQESTPIVKCEAYTVTFPGGKPPQRTCLRLSDIVGMAINNEDRPRIEAAISEAKDVDMSLSHIHETPLSLAALNAKTELVGWLLGKGAKINFQTKNGYTALMFAALSSASDKKAIADTITLLLKSGADKGLRNSRGESALDQATLAKNPDAIKLLK